jgi:hypothetical protein
MSWASRAMVACVQVRCVPEFQGTVDVYYLLLGGIYKKIGFSHRPNF